MKMYSFILFSILFVFCGCLNIVNHIETKITETYESSYTIWNDGVFIWNNVKFQEKYPYQTMVIMYTYPFWIIDLPFECVADTLTYPYDLYNKRKNLK